MGQIYDKCWVPGTPVKKKGNSIQAFVRNRYQNDVTIEYVYLHTVKFETVKIQNLVVNYAYDAHIHQFGPTLDFVFDESSLVQIRHIFRQYSALPVHTWLTHFYLTFRVCQILDNFQLLLHTFVGGLWKQLRDISPIEAQKNSAKLAYLGMECKKKTVDIRACANVYLAMSEYKKGFSSDLVTGAYPGIGRKTTPGFGPGFGYHLDDIYSYCLKRHGDRIHTQAMVLYLVFCKVSDTYNRKAFTVTYFYTVGAIDQFYRDKQKPLLPLSLPLPLS